MTHDVPNHLRLWGRRSLPPSSYRVVIVRADTLQHAMQISPLRQECTPFDSVLTGQLRDGIQPGEIREILAITATEVVWQGAAAIWTAPPPEATDDDHDPNRDHGSPVG